MNSSYIPNYKFTHFKQNMDLLEAVKNRNLSEVNDLLSSNNVDVNVRDEDGKTPLHIAVINKDMGIINDLLSSDNIDINSQDNAGKTPLLYAYDLDLINRLLSIPNIDENIPDNTGRRFIDYVRYASPRIREILLLREQQRQRQPVVHINNSHLSKNRINEEDKCGICVQLLNEPAGLTNVRPNVKNQSSDTDLCHGQGCEHVFHCWCLSLVPGKQCPLCRKDFDRNHLLKLKLNGGSRRKTKKRRRKTKKRKHYKSKRK